MLIPILLGCNSKENGQNSTVTNSQNIVDSSKSKTPQFEGKWLSEDKSWKINIQKVNNTIYDVQFQNDKASDKETIEYTINVSSGSYTLSDDQQSITKGRQEEERSHYQQITFSNDGRLYTSAGKFYTRQ